MGCTEEMQREISGLFQHTLPEGSSVQFMLWADPRIGDLLENWAKPRGDQGEVFTKLASRRINHLGDQVFNAHEMASPRNFRCIISYSQKGNLENPVDEKKFLDLSDQIVTAIKTLGVPVKLWEADDLLQTVDGILNFDGTIKGTPLKWNAYDSLESQIPKSGNSLSISKDHISLNEGESIIRTYSVRREPDQ